MPTPRKLGVELASEPVACRIAAGNAANPSKWVMTGHPALSHAGRDNSSDLERRSEMYYLYYDSYSGYYYYYNPYSGDWYWA